jgi:formamidopyrimidine-DNA glycosylase
MPELPEVETTCRGIEPHIVSATVIKVVIRQHQLRWLIPDHLVTSLTGRALLAVERRAKYILLKFEHGELVIHLGMSGSLRVLKEPRVAEKHDHFDMVLDNGATLRLTDPRRFGAVLWQSEQHPLSILQKMGPEPLTSAFNIDALLVSANNRKVAIKQFIMDNKVVVGVGNIYATEALFAAGINPQAPVNQLSRAKLVKLISAIKYILGVAIERGGTTLKDFVDAQGQPGYFAQELQVYGRKGQTCNNCQKDLLEIKQGQRSTVFCPSCQRMPRVKK